MTRRRILLWHGWLLEGSGSNVYTARVAEVYRSQGHDVALVCQERHVERYRWIDASATADAEGMSPLAPNPSAVASTAGGRCVLVRPHIGRVLPVFVLDEYEGFEVKRFVDLRDDVLQAYLDANVGALRAIVAWHDSDVVIAGHAIPGSAIARRALGDAPYVVKIHGSDLEYAIREDPRYVALASEGLVPATAVVGASHDVLRRCRELVPGVERVGPVVPPGVDVDAFRPREGRSGLLETAALLERDPDVERGRPASLDAEVDAAVAARDAAALGRLAASYDQAAPEPAAAGRLRALAASSLPLVGYLGKLIPQKGVELLLEGAAALAIPVDVLVVGFGSHREWLGALARALVRGDAAGLAWMREVTGIPPDGRASPARASFTFTGRLDHRYAPGALASMDVLVVPSVMAEAFGMVTAEGAAAGALPLVARHSGLAEIASALEGDVGRPGLFSFEPGVGAARRIAEGLERLLALAPDERAGLAAAASRHVRREWSWRATADRLLRAAR